MHKYHLEFILSILADISGQTLKNSLVEFAEQLEIVELPQGGDTRSKDFKVCISTEDPTIVFDACAQFGRIKAVKIEEKEE